MNQEDNILIVGGTYSEAHYWASLYAMSHDHVALPAIMSLHDAARRIFGTRRSIIYLVGSADSGEGRRSKGGEIIVAYTDNGDAKLRGQHDLQTIIDFANLERR